MDTSQLIILWHDSYFSLCHFFFVFNLLIFDQYIGSCDTSIRRAHLVLHPFCDSNNNNNVHRNCLNRIICWLCHLHRSNEQFGSLQFRDFPQMAFLYFPSTQVPYVYSHVSSQLIYICIHSHQVMYIFCLLYIELWQGSSKGRTKQERKKFREGLIYFNQEVRMKTSLIQELILLSIYEIKTKLAEAYRLNR